MKRLLPVLALSPALVVGVVIGLAGRGTASTEKVIRIAAKKFEFEPAEITLKRGEEVILEVVTLDRIHGFKVPGLGLRAEALPGEVMRLRVTPDKTGSFEATCDVFCGEGHEDMDMRIVVIE